MTPFLIVSLLVLAAPTPTLASQRAAAIWRGSVDTVDGIARVVSPPTPLIRAADVHVARDLVLGVEFGDSLYEFGNVWDVSIGPTGTIHVVDVQRCAVLAYDVSGIHRHTIGRCGGGPGEFRLPARAFWIADTLAIWDSRLLRLSLFGVDGALLRDTLVRAWSGVQSLGWWPRVGFIAQRGPRWRSPPQSDNGMVTLVNWTASGESIDLMAWSDSGAFVALTEPGIASTANIPFAPRRAWAGTSRGTVYVAAGDTYRVVEYRGVTPIRQIERQYRRSPPSRRELLQAREQVRSIVEEFRRPVQVPDRKPATGVIKATSADYLWVQTFTPHDETRQQWDVFDPGGRYLVAIFLPPNLRVTQVTDRHVIGTTTDSLDVVRIERFSYSFGADARR